jgi:hypothetical protein
MLQYSRTLAVRKEKDAASKHPGESPGFYIRGAVAEQGCPFIDLAQVGYLRNFFKGNSRNFLVRLSW